VQSARNHSPVTDAESSDSQRTSFAIRAFRFALLVWVCCIAAAAITGGLASFWTGRTEELPKWNGWSYLVFCGKEGAILGAILTWPLALFVLVVRLLHRHG
jgi:hypothetical protein